MPASEKLLQLTDVTKRYAAAGGTDGVAVLGGISLAVSRGETLAIVGPSGSGKSTLLQIIGTLDHATSGRVELASNDLSQLNDEQLAAVRNRQIGFVFQSHFLLPQCTVWENVLVPTLALVGQASCLSGGSHDNPARLITGTPQQTGKMPVPLDESAPTRAERLLKRVGLAERLHHFPGQLSGGERQRVAVVRALINQPQLLLADEPTGALDHASATNLGQLLVELNLEEGVTLIVVTHSRELAQRMGRVLTLRDGKLCDDEK
jgi:ABC-type lipoprotein export system ATPase subunit